MLPFLSNTHVLFAALYIHLELIAICNNGNKKGEIGKQGLPWWSEHCVVKTYTCKTTIHLNAFDSTRRASYSSYTHVCKEPPSKIERRSISAGPDARPSTSHLQSPVGLHFKVGSPAATERRDTSASRNIPQHEHSRSGVLVWQCRISMVTVTATWPRDPPYIWADLQAQLI